MANLKHPDFRIYVSQRYQGLGFRKFVSGEITTLTALTAVGAFERQVVDIVAALGITPDTLELRSEVTWVGEGGLISNLSMEFVLLCIPGVMSIRYLGAAGTSIHIDSPHGTFVVQDEVLIPAYDVVRDVISGLKKLGFVTVRTR